MDMFQEMSVFQETSLLLYFLNALGIVMIIFLGAIYGWVKRIAIQLGYTGEEQDRQDQQGSKESQQDQQESKEKQTVKAMMAIVAIIIIGAAFISFATF